MPLIPKLERHINREETALTHGLILRFLEAGLPIRTKVEVKSSGWLFCFSDFHVEPQFLSLGFYELGYIPLPDHD